MRNKRKIFLFCLAAFLLAVPLVWRRFFHLRTLTEGQTAYEPGFFYAAADGRREFRRIQDGRLTRDEGEYRGGRRAGYPEAAERRLQSRGYGRDCGQLLFYHNYPIGEVYAYSGDEGAWRVFLASEQGIREFQVEKSSAQEALTDCVADGEFIYLHCVAQDEIAVVQLEAAAGEPQRMAVSNQILGLREPGQFWFDPRAQRLIAWVYSGGRREILFYSFETGEKHIMHLNQPAETLIAVDGGYAAVLPKYGGRVFFYFYDMDWKPIPEKEGYVDLAEDGAALTPLSRDSYDNEATWADGVVYGCIEGEDALWYYAIDLEAREPAAFWELQRPKGKLELWDHILFHKETNREPYPTLF